MSEELCHCVTELVCVPAGVAYRFLADGLALGRWAMGCWSTEAAGDGLYRGHSLFDGQPFWVRIEGDAALLQVLYHVGNTPAVLVPRIMTKVMPGPYTGRGANECLVSLLAWHDAGLSADRWRRLTASHKAEIVLIKALIERR